MGCKSKSANFSQIKIIVLLVGIFFIYNFYIQNTESAALPAWFLIFVGMFTYLFGLWFFSHIILNQKNLTNSILMHIANPLFMNRKNYLHYSDLYENQGVSTQKPCIINNAANCYFLIQKSNQVVIENKSVVELKETDILLGILDPEPMAEIIPIYQLADISEKTGMKVSKEFNNIKLHKEIGRATISYQVRRISLAETDIPADSFSRIKKQPISNTIVASLMSLKLSEILTCLPNHFSWAHETNSHTNKKNSFSSIEQIKEIFINECLSGLAYGPLNISISILHIAFNTLDSMLTKVPFLHSIIEPFQEEKQIKDNLVLQYRNLTNEYISKPEIDAEITFRKILDLLQ